ncbi:glycosyltransferase [Qipengyuania sp. GH1]|uniref:glycosyltransferase n=1 Tax=Qipengyuania aestuarii TaxID=2867241 RepID=UPI001C88CC9F|nr:glycosyltransferase [Qipengyuania aestuarii]MBX7535481.1 glycosyltransferase [Qipengyuania aestuarii]
MKPSVIYVTRNGLLEPLGQSQVLGYLLQLSNDYDIVLFTREKEADWANLPQRQRQKAQCETHNIDWRPSLFKPRRTFLTPLRDMLDSALEVKNAVLETNASLIHARSYLSAAVARWVSRKTGVPFIFDMRALWPEELIVAKKITRGGIPHRVLTLFEKLCLRDAAAVISLTHAASRYLKATYPQELQNKAIEVIPTCADLNRFRPGLTKPVIETHAAIGTMLSGWFLTEWLRNWFELCEKRSPNCNFEVITRDAAVLVRKQIDPLGRLGGRLKIQSKTPDEMPLAIQGHSTSAMFFTNGVAKLGSAPTRLAEVLGCGVPVIVNEGVGDVAEIVRTNKIGVVVSSATPDELEHAYDELEILRRDRHLPARCRETAQEIFSLTAGANKFREVYARIINFNSISTDHK